MFQLPLKKPYKMEVKANRIIPRTNIKLPLINIKWCTRYISHFLRKYVRTNHLLNIKHHEERNYVETEKKKQFLKGQYIPKELRS